MTMNGHSKRRPPIRMTGVFFIFLFFGKAFSPGRDEIPVQKGNGSCSAYTGMVPFALLKVVGSAFICWAWRHSKYLPATWGNSA